MSNSGLREPATTTMPAAPARPRSRRLRAPLLTAGGVGLGVAALAARDPHAAGSYGMCPYLLVTGFYCPGCGILRGVNHLANGEVGAAVGSNLLFFVVVAPALAFTWVLWAAHAWTGQPPSDLRLGRVGRTILVVAAVLLTVTFTVVRNTPAGAWLAP